MPNSEYRYVCAGLASALLVCALLLVLSISRYEALKSEASTACVNVAAKLDLSSWVPLCVRVMPEDLR